MLAKSFVLVLSYSSFCSVIFVCVFFYCSTFLIFLNLPFLSVGTAVPGHHPHQTRGLVAREETPKPNGSNLPTATGTPATGSPATGVVSVSRGSVRLVSSGLTERRVEAPQGKGWLGRIDCRPIFF